MSEQIKVTANNNIVEQGGPGKIEEGKGLNISNNDFEEKLQELIGVNFSNNEMFNSLLAETKNEVLSGEFKHKLLVIDGINFDLVVLQQGEVALRNKYNNQPNNDPRSEAIVKRAGELGVAVYPFDMFH